MSKRTIAEIEEYLRAWVQLAGPKNLSYSTKLRTARTMLQAFVTMGKESEAASLRQEIEQISADAKYAEGQMNAINDIIEFLET